MQGLTKKSIMQSKLLVNVQEDGSPCITVLQKHLKPNEEFILGERVLQQFFERLNHESNFLGVINEGTGDENSVKTIIPLTIPHAIEWLQRFFADRIGKNSSGNLSPEYIAQEQKKIEEAFGIIHELYFGPDKSVKDQVI